MMMGHLNQLLNFLNLEFKDKEITLPEDFQDLVQSTRFHQYRMQFETIQIPRPKSDPESTKVFMRNMYRTPQDLNQNDYWDYP
ncbi:unnamed protein product [Paramecium sonneborni]|uniref:Uncharacterized protein n=1 Tax=Paramecium sonneborni TaxID=65129 RepID=A0A8S1RRL0_9CILI|nr:unnamed protein product [Paramecium sonneborni]